LAVSTYCPVEWGKMTQCYPQFLPLPACDVLPSVANNGTDGDSVCTPLHLMDVKPKVVTGKDSKFVLLLFYH
jgi:hypothetical protein